MQVDLPPDMQLGEHQIQDLDDYLTHRRRGQFSMAGIRFWPEMRSLPARIQEKLGGFKQLVSIFTNVIFDTSQIHANTLYPHMFAWLEDIVAACDAHPDTLFVIRAHPDEDRPGKASRESVQQWVADRQLDTRKNAVFIPPGEYVSSYELIERSKFASVYNRLCSLSELLRNGSGKPPKVINSSIPFNFLCGSRIVSGKIIAFLFSSARVKGCK